MNIYRRRLRTQATQELLAGLGIAVAVALIFATLVANTSIAGSASGVLHQIVGPATLQLRTLGSKGFDESLLKRVEQLPAVKQAAPVLEEYATLRTPRSHAPLLVVGGDVALTTLDGLAHTLPAATLERGSLALTREAAEALNAPASPRAAAGMPVTLDVRGRAVPLKVATVLGPEVIGPIWQARVAVMSLEELQRYARLPHRISRVFVQAKPGQETRARDELEALAAGRVAVASSDQDLQALEQALQPSAQASTLFAVIATLLGFLFAFNAVLLTAPERRAAIADFRLGGARRSVIAEIVLFQALCLGLVAGLVGALGGYVLLRTALHTRPEYLAEAFTLSGGTVIGLGPIVFAVAAGVVATCLASCIPLLDLRRRRALDAVYFEDGEPGNWIDSKTVRRLGMIALALLLVATALWILAPAQAIVTAGLIAVADVLAVPIVFAYALRLASSLAERAPRFTTLTVALRSLRATTLRSLALVATGVVALFGAVALGGAREDLLSGMRAQASDGAVGAQLHLINPGDTQEVTSFPATEAASRIARIPGVVAVQPSYGQFLPLGNRLVAVFAHPLASTTAVARDEIVEGAVPRAVQQLSEGGWVTVSSRLASELHVRPGGVIVLPTPTGKRTYHVAAITTSLGWPGGAVLMNASDFSRAWATNAPSALDISLARPVDVARVQHAIEALVAPGDALEVVRVQAWAQRFYGEVNEGLVPLGEITAMLTIAAILAMVAAVTAMIWSRRTSLSGLRLSGVKPGRLRRILLIETLFLLGTGCVVGVVSGIYGQVVLDSYIKRSAGFPLTTFGGGVWPLEILFAVAAIVLVLALLPGISASRVPPALALADE